MYAMACSAAGRLRDSLCNFLQIGDATFSKNILQLSGKKPCKKQDERKIYPVTLEQEEEADRRWTEGMEKRLAERQKKKLKESLDEEIERNRERFKRGWYMDDYLPPALAYNTEFSEEIIKAVMVENPRYLQEWPLLRGVLSKDIIEAVLEVHPDVFENYSDVLEDEENNER